MENGARIEPTKNTEGTKEVPNTPKSGEKPPHNVEKAEDEKGTDNRATSRGKK